MGDEKTLAQVAAGFDGPAVDEGRGIRKLSKAEFKKLMAGRKWAPGKEPKRKSGTSSNYQYRDRLTGATVQVVVRWIEGEVDDWNEKAVFTFGCYMELKNEGKPRPDGDRFPSGDAWDSLVGFFRQALRREFKVKRGNSVSIEGTVAGKQTSRASMDGPAECAELEMEFDVDIESIVDSLDHWDPEREWNKLQKGRGVDVKLVARTRRDIGGAVDAYYEPPEPDYDRY